MINRQDVDELFQKMRKAGWNMDNQKTWGYFFKDTSRNKLSHLSKHLTTLGYEVVDINQSYPDEMFWLHVEKIEIHNEKTLHELNQFFYQLAKDNHIQEYDGMDISPADI